MFLSDHLTGDSFDSAITGPNAEWRLDLVLFREVTNHFGTPLVNLFATQANCQTTRFFARFPMPTKSTPCAAHGLQALRLSPSPSDFQRHQEATGRGGRASAAGPAWPQRPWLPSWWLDPGASLQTGYPSAGGGGLPRPSVAPTDRLVLERSLLRGYNLSSRVIDTIQASRQASTNRIYNTTWRAFSGLCFQKDLVPMEASTAHILDFLQDGLERRLLPSTLQRQVAALSPSLSCGSSGSLSQLPLIRQFLGGPLTSHGPPLLHLGSHEGVNDPYPGPL